MHFLFLEEAPPILGHMPRQRALFLALCFVLRSRYENATEVGHNVPDEDMHKKATNVGGNVCSRGPCRFSSQ